MACGVTLLRPAYQVNRSKFNGDSVYRGFTRLAQHLDD